MAGITVVSNDSLPVESSTCEALERGLGTCGPSHLFVIDGQMSLREEQKRFVRCTIEPRSDHHTVNRQIALPGHNRQTAAAATPLRSAGPDVQSANPSVSPTTGVQLRGPEGAQRPRASSAATPSWAASVHTTSDTP